MVPQQVMPQPIGDSIAYDLNQGNVNLTEIHHQNVIMLRLGEVRTETAEPRTKNQELGAMGANKGTREQRNKRTRATT